MEIKNTAEKYYGYCFKLLLILAVATAAIFAVPLLAAYFTGEMDAEEMTFVCWVLGATLGLCFVIPTVYYLVQFLYYRKVELTDVQEALLSGTSTGHSRAIGFRAEIEVDGVTRSIITKRVFSADRMSPTKLDDYAGKVKRIGYNRDRDEFIVLADE
ncbi:MAG: hypothetical protein J6P98_04150 [Clostridia bacterium]|nr:hypothetical protein [Clostridia bacterium]